MTLATETQDNLKAENVWLRHRLEMAEAAMQASRKSTAAALDSTLAKAAETAEENLAATLGNFIVSAPVGIFVLDVNMRYVYVNEHLAEIHGVPVSAHFGKTVQEIIPNLYEKTAIFFHTVLSEGAVIPDGIVEGETPKAPGVKSTWQVCWFPATGSDGQPNGVSAIVREITEQQRIETQQRQVHATEQLDNHRVVTLMESLTEGLCVFDKDFRFTYVNSAAEQISGMNRQELIGRTQWDVFPSCMGTVLERQLRRAMTEQITIQFENYYAVWDTWYALKAYPSAEGGLCVLWSDITQTKRASAAIQRADELMRGVFDNQTVGMIQWNLDRGLITSANTHFLKMVGYSAEDVSAGRLGFRAMTPPEWTARNEDGISQIRQLGRAPAYEKEYFRKDGARVPIMIAGVSFENDINQGMSVVIDLTDTKRAEAELRASEGRFRAAVGAISSIVWTSNAQVMMSGEQPSWTAFTGQDHDSYQGFGWVQCVHPDDVQPTLDVWQKAMRETAAFEFEHRVRRKDGKWRLCSVRTVPVLDSVGKLVEWVGVHTDITRQRQAETKIKASEVRYRRLFESAKDGILILDAHTATITDANPFIAEILGYSLDQLLGKELWQIGLFKDMEASKMAMRELKEKRYIRYEDLPLQTKAGQRLYVEFVSNVYGEAGEAVIQCNIRDISDRKQLEENLRQHAVQLLTADRRKDEFLATLAHELRNPLAPIQNGLQIMRLAGKDETAKAQCLDMMERQLRQMVQLVDDLLDVSRISRGRLDLKKQRIDLMAVLNNAVETSRPQIQASGHELAVVVPSQPVYLDADLTRLGQVFSNLLNNAAKYSEQGGHIALTASLLGSDVVVRIKDCGVGIEPDMLTKIFEMFTQVKHSIEKAQGGLGIGLCLVKQLVELHGGSVHAYSEGLGHGSEFVVRLPTVLSDALLPLPPLPLLPPSSAEVLPNQPVDSPPARAVKAHAAPFKRRILVADDNVDSVTTLAMYLTLLGNEVRTANDGLEAVNVAAQFQPDVILLDIGMPKLNGFDACRRIREQPGCAKAFVVALTGWGQDEDRRRSLQAGFDHHLVKPMDPEALDRLLAGLQARQE